MKFTPFPILPEVILIEPDVHQDGRGFFKETYQADRYEQHGVPSKFVQDNLSYSARSGVLRGLHYQLGHPQGKLVSVVQGEAFDVAVDIRRGSSTFGRWVGAILSSGNHQQLYIPEGFAHGFCVTSKTAVCLYKCTDYYAPAEERGIRWDDPLLKITWPVSNPLLSEKDQLYPTLDSISKADLPALLEPQALDEPVLRAGLLVPRDSNLP